jgi:hypothetical protein
MPQPEFGPNSICCRVWRVAHELPETDETVLFDEKENELLVLSATGAAVWHLLDGQRTLGQIARFIASSAPLAPADVEGEVIDFALVLGARGAIVEQPIEEQHRAS